MRNREPQAHDPSRHDQKTGCGYLQLHAMGLRVIRKVEAIVREEMNRAGAIEMTMPVVQPAELWQETGRFDKMGPELLRIQDRHGRDFCRTATSEEVVTDVARQELRSYKQLPKNFYQIQTSSATSVARVWPDAWARIHHEGRLQLRQGSSRCQGQLPEHGPGLPQDL